MVLATVKKGKPELRKKGENCNPHAFDLQESNVESGSVPCFGPKITESSVQLCIIEAKIFTGRQPQWHLITLRFSLLFPCKEIENITWPCRYIKEFCFRVLKNISWVSTANKGNILKHKKADFASPSDHVNFFFYIIYSQYIMTFVAIFWRFPKIFQNLSEARRTLPNIFWRWPKKTRRWFDHTPTNSSVVKGTKNVIKNNIFSFENIIMFLSIYYHLVYH